MTPNIDSITADTNSLKSVEKAFEIFDNFDKDPNIIKKPKTKSENLDKLDVNINLAIPVLKDKDMTSPLKPPICVFPPLETLKEEESIIEEKSSEYPIKDDDDFKNVPILEGLGGDDLPKKLCIKCCRCMGTGIDQSSSKKGKACKKCVKGFIYLLMKNSYYVYRFFESQ